MGIIDSGLLGIGPAVAARAPKIFANVSLNPNKVAEDELKRKEAEAQAAQAANEDEVQSKKKGGKISSASSRADGCATKGKTRGKMI